MPRLGPARPLPAGGTVPLRDQDLLGGGGGEPEAPVPCSLPVAGATCAASSGDEVGELL